MFSNPTADRVQGADQSALLRIANAAFQALFDAPKEEDGIRIWVDARMPSDFALEQASAMFDFVLGILRAWKPEAGELRIEQARYFAPGSFRDDAGNQWVFAGTAMAYATFGGELEQRGQQAKNATKNSEHLRGALMLNGRARRTAADYYMIHEYACMEFGDPNGVKEALNVSSSSRGC